MNQYLKCLLFWLLFIGAGRTAVCQNYIFAQLTGTPMNTSGWNLAGDAHVANVIGSADSELVICRAALENSGAAFFGQPINLSICNKWIAEFDFRMYDGTGQTVWPFVSWMCRRQAMSTGADWVSPILPTG